MKRTICVLFNAKEVIFAQVVRLNRNMSMQKKLLSICVVLNRREVHELVVGYFRVSEKWKPLLSFSAYVSTWPSIWLVHWNKDISGNALAQSQYVSSRIWIKGERPDHRYPQHQRLYHMGLESPIVWNPTNSGISWYCFCTTHPSHFELLY